MISQYNITIKNKSDHKLEFFVFQKQASFQNEGVDFSINSCSLAVGSLAPNKSSGAQLMFGFDKQNYIGVKSSNHRDSPSGCIGTLTESFAAQPVSLTSSNTGAEENNFSHLKMNSLGLSPPAYKSGIPEGSFGIRIPPYTPNPSVELSCGCAAMNQDGSVTLSSYITPLPNSNFLCRPEPIFFVKVGSHPVGAGIEYSTNQAAKCDFSTGVKSISVEYLMNGTFKTSSSRNKIEPEKKCAM